MTMFRRVQNFTVNGIPEATMMLTGGAAMVEQMGAAQFADADQMPVKIFIEKGDLRPAAEVYKSMGFLVPENQDGKDPLFLDAILPEGWTKTICSKDPSGRTIHICDDEGARRISVWYKASSYDRAARATVLAEYKSIPHGDNSVVEAIDNRVVEMRSEADKLTIHLKIPPDQELLPTTAAFYKVMLSGVPEGVKIIRSTYGGRVHFEFIYLSEKYFLQKQEVIEEAASRILSQYS